MKNYTLKIQNWSHEDLPREKFITKGRESCSDAEILAILIGTGTKDENVIDLSKRILQMAGNSLNTLSQYSINDLRKIKGIGEAKALTISASLELGRRRLSEPKAEKIRITSSNESFWQLHRFFDNLDHEEFRVMYLNRANIPIKIDHISTGGTAATVVDIKIIMKKALEYMCSAIILAHNHPSGSLDPSEQDITLTQKIKSACTFFDIKLLDHLIIHNDLYYSFADNSII
jgi:DNA repair protein RadC